MREEEVEVEEEVSLHLFISLVYLAYVVIHFKNPIILHLEQYEYEFRFADYI